MPKVSINIIKDWFKNQMKPPQEQFWAWLDSFWHKDEPIPQSAVENLVTTLQKKADLVDGVVPEEQLPFSVKTSEVIALGNVTVEGANANLAVHSSGANAVRVNGVIRERTFPNAFPFTPLSFGSVKVLRGYALNDPALFYMAEGEELDEYKEPEIPDTALEIFKITLTPAGAIIDILSQIGGFKPKESDAWKSVLLTNDAATFLQHTVEASTYELNVSGAVSAPKICGLITKQGKYMWGGKPLLFYNNSGLPIQLLPAESIPENPNAKYIPFATGTSYIIKPGEYALIKEKADKLIVVKLGGSASFPEGAAPGDVLTEGTEGPVWSGRLTAVETNKQDKSMFSALVDKWIHYWDSTTQKMQPILKLVSGVVNQLEFSGRIKADAIVLPNNSNAVVPNRLRSNGSILKYSDDSSVEHDIAYTTDITGQMILSRYVHSANREIQGTAVDYTTGYVTAVGHGFTNGSTPKLVGLFANGLSSAMNGNTKFSAVSAIPWEWVTSDIFVKVIDADTLMICNSAGSLIPVNPTSAQNNGRIGISGWHIEDFGNLDVKTVPNGYRNFKIIIKGMALPRGFSSSTTKFFFLNFWLGGVNTTFFQSNNTQAGEARINIALFTGNSNKQSVYFSHIIEMNFGQDVLTPYRFFETSIQYTGAGTISVKTLTESRIYPMPISSTGLGGITQRASGFGVEPCTIANGTVIEFYRI